MRCTDSARTSRAILKEAATDNATFFLFFFFLLRRFRCGDRKGAVALPFVCVAVHSFGRGYSSNDGSCTREVFVQLMLLLLLLRACPKQTIDMPATRTPRRSSCRVGISAPVTAWTAHPRRIHGNRADVVPEEPSRHRLFPLPRDECACACLVQRMAVLMSRVPLHRLHLHHQGRTRSDGSGGHYRC